jgi:hypothetical protein
VQVSRIVVSISPNWFSCVEPASLPNASPTKAAPEAFSRNRLPTLRYECCRHEQCWSGRPALPPIVHTSSITCCDRNVIGLRECAWPSMWGSPGANFLQCRFLDRLVRIACERPSPCFLALSIDSHPNNLVKGVGNSTRPTRPIISQFQYSATPRPLTHSP